MYILFGPPGVGKTYIGQLLSDTFGFFFFDADQLYDEPLKKKIQNNTYTQSDRDQFIEKLIKTVKVIAEQTNKDVVIAEAFTKDVNRRRFLEIFPNSKFIYVNAFKDIAKNRMHYRLLREKHVIEEQSFNQFWNEFEKPTVKYTIINNIQSTNADLISSFNELK